MKTVRGIFSDFFKLLLGSFSVFDNHVLRTDSQNLELLLSNPIDQKNFEITVDELKTGNVKSKKLTLSTGKEITISI